MTRLRRHLTYSNVMSTIAVFGVLGGTAWASHETIFSSDIVNGEVRNVDIRADAVTRDKVLDGTLRATDLEAESIGSGRIRDNTLTGTDVLNDSLTGIDIANDNTTGALTGTDIAKNSLTGDDIEDGSLSGDETGVFTVPRTELVDNQILDVLNAGTIALRLGCFIDSAGDDTVSVIVEIGGTTGGSLAKGDTEPPDFQEADLSFSQRPLVSDPHPAAGSDRFDHDVISITAADATSVTGVVWGGLNLNGTTDRCFVGGHLVASP